MLLYKATKKFQKCRWGKKKEKNKKKKGKRTADVM